MPRFIRSKTEPEFEREPEHDDLAPSDEDRVEMLERVQAYAAPLTPDPESPLTPREQLVNGITRPGRPAPPRRRARY
jgi:hypothetical protein